MRRTLFHARSCLAILFPMMAASCALDSQKKPPAPAAEKVANDTQSILGGNTDSANSATVYLQGNGHACSGTIIHVSGSFGYVLTAAHCSGMTQIVYMPPGVTDIQSAGAQGFNVDADTVDPAFTDPSTGHDFRILRFSGANASLVVVPAANNPDGLNVGSQIDISGFGLTSPGGQPSSTRMHVTMPISQLDAQFIQYDQTGGQGACSGDSGGPAYATVGGVKSVVGVTSFGDQNCTQYGVSGRVELDYNSFIAPTIGAAVMETCSSCSASALASGGACYAQVMTCENDMAAGGCNALVTCLNACAAGNTTCEQACGNAASNTGINEYNAIFQCSTCTQCKTLCPQTSCNGTSSSVTSANATVGSGPGTTSGTGSAGGASATGSTGATTGAGGSGSSGGDHLTTVTTCGCKLPGSDNNDAPFGIAALAAGVGVVVARRRRR